jgi:hypothetical protein
MERKRKVPAALTGLLALAAYTDLAYALSDGGLDLGKGGELLASLSRISVEDLARSTAPKLRKATK